jgi:hypothetical protein
MARTVGIGAVDEPVSGPGPIDAMESAVGVIVAIGPPGRPASMAGFRSAG